MLQYRQHSRQENLFLLTLWNGVGEPGVKTQEQSLLTLSLKGLPKSFLFPAPLILGTAAIPASTKL
eukprot:13127053-Ditylum_brightwellii.AAC.1